MDATFLFHAGMIDYRLGDTEAARAYLGQAVDINPGFSVLYAQTAIETLRQLDFLTRASTRAPDVRV